MQCLQGPVLSARAASAHPHAYPATDPFDSSTVMDASTDPVDVVASSIEACRTVRCLR